MFQGALPFLLQLAAQFLPVQLPAAQFRSLRFLGTLDLRQPFILVEELALAAEFRQLREFVR